MAMRPPQSPLASAPDADDGGLTANVIARKRTLLFVYVTAAPRSHQVGGSQHRAYHPATIRPPSDDFIVSGHRRRSPPAIPVALSVAANHRDGAIWRPCFRQIDLRTAGWLNISLILTGRQSTSRRAVHDDLAPETSRTAAIFHSGILWCEQANRRGGAGRNNHPRKQCERGNNEGTTEATGWAGSAPSSLLCRSKTVVRQGLRQRRHASAESAALRSPISAAEW